MATSAKDIGISTSKVSKMSNSISSYVRYVKKNTAVSATTQQIRKAIKGSASEKTLTQLSNQLNTTLANYLSYLNQFNNQLSTLTATYSKNDSSNTTFTSAKGQLNK